MSVAHLILTRNGEGYDGRFPGKGMASLLGKPLTYWIYQRCLKSNVDTTIVALPMSRESDVLAELAYAMGVLVFRGDPVDTIDRKQRAMETFGAQWAVTISGDCPFTLPAASNYIVNTIRERRLDPKEWWIVRFAPTRGTLPEGILPGAHSLHYYKALSAWNDKTRAHGTDREQAIARTLTDPEWIETYKTREFTLDPAPFIDEKQTYMKLSIDYPLELAIANRVCEYNGGLPESLDEIERAYRYIYQL